MKMPWEIRRNQGRLNLEKRKNIPVIISKPCAREKHYRCQKLDTCPCHCHTAEA